MPCDLIANRFAVIDHQQAIDLATGARVLLTVTSAGDASRERRWTVRCDGLRQLHHRSIVPLVDYGAIGTTHRFEAWAGGAPWIGASDVCVQTIERANAFLHACGLSVGAYESSACDRIRQRRCGATLLPGEDDGYPIVQPARTTSADTTVEQCGLELIPRRGLAAVAELFEPARSPRTRAVRLWGPAGAGKAMAILELARLARLAGFVPVRAPLLATPLVATLDGLSLFVIDDSGVRPWQGLIEAALRSPRPHVLLLVGEDEIDDVDNVALERFSPARLAEAVRPTGIPAVLTARIQRAADRAQGLPGRFAQLLWGATPGRASRRSGGSRAAEQTAAYGVEQDMMPAAPADVGPWPAPGELATLRRRAQQGAQLVERGRHAPGDRLLRQSAASLARRNDWAHAVHAALALAASIARRGRAKDAQAVLADARGYAHRAGDEGASIDVAVRSGHVWIDLARLDEAETALSAAASAAAALGDKTRSADATIGLARCLFWRGRYADARLAAQALEPQGLSDRALVRAAIATSRSAVGERDVAAGVSAATDAVQRAMRHGDAGLLSRAACASAFAHLAVDDGDALERDVILAVASARKARDPLRALRARLMLAEFGRRHGERAAAAGLVERLRTIGVALPAVVRARRDLLADLLAPSAAPEQVVTRLVAATGLPALALFAPAPPRADSVAVEDIVAILGACQNADEDARVLADVCGRLRRQLDAAGVAVVAAGVPRVWIVASDGSRIEPLTAERAIAVGIAIAPHRVDDRIETAVPVRYGGDTAGAIVARWTLGTSHSLARAVPLLTMAAAAAAPALSAARATHAHRAVPAAADFLGVSTSTVDLRRAVERAASAPFSVLIEGESGSGKELIARAVHRNSSRRDRQICTLNCAALPDDLVEAELFGHARGAFTGAVGERAGVFEEASGGTLFLDEVGELSPRAQAKLLRVIQEGELRRVGENTSRRVDIRLIAATNRDLRQEVVAGRFRLDLLYRLDVIRLIVEPLRMRREDIPVLAAQCWRDAAARVGSHAVLSAATIAALARYDWPGNVRELQNVLAALAVRSPRRGVIAPAALPAQFGGSPVADSFRLDGARRTFDEHFVRAALVRSGGRRMQAAAELGVTRQGLTKLMARLGIE